jgi:hypothetical protein
MGEWVYTISRNTAVYKAFLSFFNEEMVREDKGKKGLVKHGRGFLAKDGRR